jgi:hypothetical protein
MNKTNSTTDVIDFTILMCATITDFICIIIFIIMALIIISTLIFIVLKKTNFKF